MYQHTNKNTQAETKKEFEDVLDHFSHADIKKTLDYTGITKEVNAK